MSEEERVRQSLRWLFTYRMKSSWDGRLVLRCWRRGTLWPHVDGGPRLNFVSIGGLWLYRGLGEDYMRVLLLYRRSGRITRVFSFVVLCRRPPEVSFVK